MPSLFSQLLLGVGLKLAVTDDVPAPETASQTGSRRTALALVTGITVTLLYLGTLGTLCLATVWGGLAYFDTPMVIMVPLLAATGAAALLDGVRLGRRAYRCERDGIESI
jgi:hypothetical protein